MKTAPVTQSGQTLILFTVSVLLLFLIVGLGIQAGLMYTERARLERGCEAATGHLYKWMGKDWKEAARSALKIAAANCPSLYALPLDPTSVSQSHTHDANLWRFVFNRSDGGNLVVNLKINPENSSIIDANVSAVSPNKPFIFPSPKGNPSPNSASDPTAALAGEKSITSIDWRP
jgi:hypothetical protein